MKYYININQQSNGDHEVHHSFCSYLPDIKHRKHLGDFYSCIDALAEARKTYSTADGCKFCSPTCHKR